MDNDGEIKEGFLCPICHIDFRSPKILLNHFQDKHAEEQDLLKSLKDLVGKAKSKILKVDDKDIEAIKSDATFQRYFLEKSEPQNPGISRSHIDYFKEVRRERLDHRTSETNKLIIRLDRFLRSNGSDRKQVAQELVTWLDGTTVTRCPSCAASFNITRRQHHCRLCGSIMCNYCSTFLTYEEARSITTSVYSQDPNASQSKHKDDQDTLRICLHCKQMLDSRSKVQMSQNYHPLICKLYEQLQVAKNQIQPNVDLYLKMYTSLDMGDSTYTLQDAQHLKSSIAKQAEVLDVISCKIAAIPPKPEYPREFRLQNSVRRGTSLYIKEVILTLPNLPSPAELAKKREQRLTMSSQASAAEAVHVQVKKVAVTTGWSPASVANNLEASTANVEEDPLIEQINNVRNFIQQAIQANRFEEVAVLRENLSMLKAMHKQQQKSQRENDK